MSEMPEKIYCGHVKTDEHGDKQYICDDSFELNGDTVYIRSDLHEELRAALVEMSELLNVVLENEKDSRVYIRHMDYGEWEARRAKAIQSASKILRESE
jgi:post-segregation antitoxin (ccd killing protein)